MFKLVLEIGSASDPIGKEGLHRLTVKLLKKGAGKLSADEFAEEIENTGGQISLRSSYEYSDITGDFLSRDLEKALELLSSMVLKPRFLNTEIELLKKNTLGELYSLLDEPSHLCGMAHNRKLFNGHPYGRSIIGYPGSVSAITKDDVKKYYKESIKNSKMLLIVAGDVKTEFLKKKISSLFEKNTKKTNESKEIPGIKAIKGRRINLVNKKDQSQVHIRIGNPGISRNSDDFYNLTVANTYFGGSFTSRLMTEVRVKRGLTYGIRSTISAHKSPGAVTITTFTKNETAAQAVMLIYKEIEKLQQTKINKKQLDGIKNYLIGLYPLSIETNKRLVNKLFEIFFYGLPQNSIENYMDKINEVDATDVLDSASKYYSINNSVVTALGNSKAIKEDFKSIGKISKINSDKVLDL